MYRKLEFVSAAGDNQTSIIRDNGDSSWTSFPADPANADYQAYLRWLEEGNEPLPADEPVAE